MARGYILPGLRFRRRTLGAVVAYALLLNALFAAAFNVQAIAAAIDPLAAAVDCDSTGSNGDPARHGTQHQPDCTLCSSTCPMGGLVQGLGGNAVAVVATPPSSFVLHVSARAKSSITPRSVYASDTAAQAPPAIG